jgi:hypothetical protein
MPIDERAKQFALENVVYDTIEVEVGRVLDGEFSTYLNGKALTLTWSEEMSSSGEPGEDLLVVDQDGTEWVLDIEVALRRRRP